MTDNARRRRRRFPMGGSPQPSRVEGAVDDGSDDPEVADLNAMAEDIITPAPAPREADDAQAFTPGNRLREVGGRASAYEREYRLGLLNRLLMRKLPLDSIAQELGVSVNTIMRDRTELYRRLRQEASKMDGNHMIGDTVAFYSEVQGMAMRMASSSKSADNIKLASLRTALTARNDRHRFFSQSGVFDVLQFSADEDGASSDLERLSGMVDKLLAQDDMADSMSEDMGLDIGALTGSSEDDEEEMEISLI